MTFDQFFRIIRARWLLALSVMAALVILTMGICLVLPKTYKATASVMVDLKPDPVTGMSSGMALPSVGLMATQIDIITSPALATRVARKIGMDHNDDMRAQWQKSVKGRGDFLTWAGEFLSQSLDVKPSRESNIIEISYTSVEPKFSAALANAFAEAYMDSSVQFRVDPARQYYSFFEERAKLARDKLEAAQVKLAQAQKSKGIVATDERLDAENARLIEMSSQIVALRAAQADTSVRSASAKKSPDQMQDVLNNALITNIKSDISRLDAKLEELQSRYGDAHPQVIEAKANLDSLRDRLRNETTKLTKSLNINDDITSSRSAAARAAYDEQRNKVLQLKDARNELSVLEREVDSAQKVYDAIQARLSQMGLESNNTQNNIVMVSPATEPSRHVFPKLTLALSLSLSIGALLGILIALGVELFDRRIRGPQDLLQGTGLPIIGIMPSPNPRGWMNRFRVVTGIKHMPPNLALQGSAMANSALEAGRSA
jgi:succinoglycan biosynthesis transport protein ExoP